MPKTRDQKQQIVADLSDKAAKAKSLVFTDYKGLNMSQMSEIRGKLLDEGSAEFTVTKNNLLKLALKEANLDLEDDKTLEGPVATLFSFGDEVGPIKVLTKALKDLQVGSVKSGFINGEYLDANKVKTIASLPSKDELRAKIVGSLGAPLYGMVNVLQANLRNLVYALDQIRLSKGGEK